MIRRILLIMSLFCSLPAFSQDSIYARSMIRKLTSEKCLGRGYVNNGLRNAANLIISEIKTSKSKPLFGNSFSQQFTHPVNTFPRKCEIILNKRKLEAGTDYILNPSSSALKGKFSLTRTDSVHFAANGSKKLVVTLKRKLTYSVANHESGMLDIEIDCSRFTDEPSEICVDVKNRLVKSFKSDNLGCYIEGTRSDSMVVFSAHYDHLGAMGKAFFPGANDNASGVSMVLDLIKYYSGNPPAYRTVFIFFAGEEAGLVGSKYFTEHNSIELSKIKFLVNLDLLGTGDDGIMVVNGYLHEKEFNSLNGINSEKKYLKEVKRRGKAANSDHYWFSEAGVPCFFIYTMGGIKAYHDVYDIERTLPLTEYMDVFRLITEFTAKL